MQRRLAAPSGLALFGEPRVFLALLGRLLAPELVRMQLVQAFAPRVDAALPLTEQARLVHVHQYIVITAVRAPLAQHVFIVAPIVHGAQLEAVLWSKQTSMRCVRATALKALLEERLLSLLPADR